MRSTFQPSSSHYYPASQLSSSSSNRHPLTPTSSRRHPNPPKHLTHRLNASSFGSLNPSNPRSAASPSSTLEAPTSPKATQRLTPPNLLRCGCRSPKLNTVHSPSSGKTSHRSTVTKRQARSYSRSVSRLGPAHRPMSPNNRSFNRPPIRPSDGSSTSASQSSLEDSYSNSSSPHASPALKTNINRSHSRSQSATASLPSPRSQSSSSYSPKSPRSRCNLQSPSTTQPQLSIQHASLTS